MNNEKMNVLGERIKELRLLRGYTQDEIAQMLNMKRSNFSGYETGRAIPPSNTLNQMATILQTSTDYLLGNTENPDPNTAETEFLNDLDGLELPSLFEKYNFKFEGEHLSDEEAKGIIAFLRASRSMKK